MKPPAAGPTTAEIPQHRPEEPLHPRPRLQLEDVPNYGYGHGLHGPCPETLKGPKDQSPMLCEVPQSTLPSRNRKMPARYTGFLP